VSMVKVRQAASWADARAGFVMLSIVNAAMAPPGTIAARPVILRVGCDTTESIPAVRYAPRERESPRGLSGSGIWFGIVVFRRPAAVRNHPATRTVGKLSATCRTWRLNLEANGLGCLTQGRCPGFRRTTWPGRNAVRSSRSIAAGAQT
jgi:hypothetical protein